MTKAGRTIFVRFRKTPVRNAKTSNCSTTTLLEFERAEGLTVTKLPELCPWE